eukprot:scaffold2854_cov140-Skeletonema_menzelii.AAC.17
MKGSEDYYYGSGSSADYDSYDDFDLRTRCGKGGSSGAKRGGDEAGSSSQTGSAYSQKHIRLREARKGCMKRK